ncbi:PP2C family protein-serine/threonine phosphatase [Streptomyces cyaneofuscatus]|uniref:Serine/threonine-protein phosphatase n=1 Tax=Streptomyces cyaneofuscatus TaxID=66883 RepID=A0ABZ1F529_9ACTN|nr:PP2C family protein-serine/threonine phosphatase [Streptomyces cyaneofuscatus]WSB11525.1 serine/threonine-protein phosphatase [Streptomyces cyaneofuscatus]WSD44941.1 serine/threonine-protein phosphatase [Streptomyces cyaneofuscatus]WTA88133.1 serine/threonine-protein phosphatase [Streptomyces cyaneofuscatus]
MGSPKTETGTSTKERFDPADWGRPPYAVIVVDRAGTAVRTEGETSLLPGVEQGVPLPDGLSWLAGATAAVADDAVHQGGSPRPAVEGEFAGRRFEAHPTRRADGEVVWWLVDHTARYAAEEALTAERERTSFLAEASNVLLSSLNFERCMDSAARLAAGFLADAAVVVAPAAGRRLPVTRAVKGQGVTQDLVVADPSDVPGLAEALQGFPPVPSRWIDPTSLPGWLVPDGFGTTVGSVVVTPLPGHGVPAGALILLRADTRNGFSETEETFARLFAARAGAALSAARLYAEQHSITRTLMRDLLPPRLHRVHGVEFAGGYRPSRTHERVGGDFYDVHPGPTASDPSLVVLGDVCGKGLDAAVLTGKIRNTLQALMPMADDHERVLQLLNGALLNADNTRFATLVLASVLRTENQVRLRLTSAGHPAPLVVRDDGRVEEVPTHGSLVGALDHVTARTVETSLLPGDTCVLYTDGITEARGGPLGGELFGEERLKRALAECGGMPGDAVVEHIRLLTSQWLGDGGHDDLAVVAITAPRTTHLSAVDGHTRGRYTA